MTEQRDNNEATALVDAAEQAVVELEAIEVGEPWEADSSAATPVLNELREHAAAAIFPQAIEPIGADLIADFDLHVKGFAGATFGAQLAHLHQRCVETHPALASVLRSPHGVGEVAVRAAAHAPVAARKPAELAAESQAEYQRAVAAQLHARGEFEPWARIFAEVVPGLEARISAARQPHEERTQAESEQQRQVRVERRGKLFEHYRKLGPNHKFVLEGIRGGERMAADWVASALAEGSLDMHLDALEEYLDGLPQRESPSARRRRMAGLPA